MFVRRTTAVLAGMLVAAPALARILPNTCTEEPYVPNDGGVITFWYVALL